MNIPDKWCIKNCQEVGEWFNKYLPTKTYTSIHHLKSSYLHSHNQQEVSVLTPGGALNYAELQPRTDFAEITIEQFREYVSKTTIPVKQNYSYLTKLLKKLKIK